MNLNTGDIMGFASKIEIMAAFTKSDPSFVGYYVERYRLKMGKTRAETASFLHVKDETDLDILYLHEVPRGVGMPGTDAWMDSEEVQEIYLDTGCALMNLAKIIGET